MGFTFQDDAGNWQDESQYMPDFLRKNGTYSSQLVFRRSKIVPDGLSQPRAELLVATINTQTGKEVNNHDTLH